MLISTKGRYALRVMIDLAQNDTGSYISLKDVTLEDVLKGNVQVAFPFLNINKKLYLEWLLEWNINIKNKNVSTKNGHLYKK